MTEKRAWQTFLFLLVVLFTGCGGAGSSIDSNPPLPLSFTIAANPSSVVISPNATSQIQLTLAPVNGFSGAVTVNLTGLPDGVNVSPALPFTLPAPGLTLTFTAGPAVASGSYSLTFQAASGNLTSAVPASLVIEPLATFSLNLFFSSLTVRQDGSTSGIFDITDGVTGNTNFLLNMSVAGLPAGVTATFALNPLPGTNSQQSVTLAASSSSAVVNNNSAQLVATRASDGATVSYNFAITVAPLLGSFPATGLTS